MEGMKQSGSPNGSPRLPPGNLGLPVLGETLDYLKSQNTEDPDSFVRERQAKYGRTFLTNLLGNNMVMVTAPELAELLLTDEKLFKTEWPKSTRMLLGERSVTTTQGARHKNLRSLVTGPLSLDNLKRYVPVIEERVLAQLGTWESGTTVAAYQELRKLTFSIISELIFGAKPGPQADRLSGFFNKWLVGLFSLFAVRIPFTGFAASMDARDAILEETAGILKERRSALASGAPVPNDILTRLMTEKDAQGAQLSDEDLQDNLLALLFAGHDTSASALASIIRYLSDDPAVVQKLREEHADVRSRKEAGEPLTWEDVRKMSYTEKVISEGLRVRPVVANNFKVATRDVSIDGYVIPAGHNVTLNYRSIMRSEALFPEPKAFKPERFDEKPAPYTFLPFGSGERQCPGSALARMEMAVFLYHFVNDWEWTLVNPAEATSYFPLPQPVEGLPIKRRKRSAAD
ncbi:cytochrome p450 [Klebsormidium nitens]|uniref:Cytochrome p450 n=1 Tax=Klebsormidium nitens TaxID=105231 RepID=A0A1Y1HTI4_KLENI|nr:cytochrome p450 [Klebsormidium nitens]|eukprot:GAQ79836.1 cytochrome p450 [Klebsormidium nitens]